MGTFSGRISNFGYLSFSGLNPWSIRGATVNSVSKQFRLHCSGAPAAVADTFEVLRGEYMLLNVGVSKVKHNRSWFERSIKTSVAHIAP